MIRHSFKHTENLIKGHNGILYEVLPKDNPSKFRLLEHYFFDTGIKLRKSIDIEFVGLMTTGRVHVRAGFTWDGATCFPDIQSVIRSSLEHDALYTLFILELLDQKHRKTVNGRFYDVCVKDGMSTWLAKVVYETLRMFGDNHIGNSIENRVQAGTVQTIQPENNGEIKCLLK